MSVLSLLLPVFCVVSVLLLCLVLFVLSSLFERRARDAPAVKVAMILSSPFRMRLLLLLLDVEKEIAVVEECCLMLYLLMCDFRNGFADLIICYFDC